MNVDSPSAPDGGLPVHLAQQLAALAQDVPRGSTSPVVAELLATRVVDVVPGVTAASVAVTPPGRRRRPVPTAASLQAALDFGLLQERLHEGSCFDAVDQHQPVRSADIRRDTRWPRLAERAADHPWVSALCLPLRAGGEDVGEMTLLADGPDAFDDGAEAVALLLAAHAAIALSHARQVESLQLGMQHRDVIGQAKGILMERHRLSADQAFELLSRVSQDSNRRLHDLAVDLAETGDLDGLLRRDR